MGSISAPDGATVKEEAHALQCTTAGPCDAFPTDLLRVRSMCGLGIDLCGIWSGTLVNGLAKIRAARNDDGASIYALTSEWEEKFLTTSMSCSTMEAREYVYQMDRAGRIADSPEKKIQKAATTLLCDTIQKRDFASRIAAPESWDQSADISWPKSYR